VDIQGMKKLPSGGYEVGHSAQVIGFSRDSGVVLWTPGTPIGALKHDFALLVERSR
jgi:protein SCO1/2